jgi:hypothetical protein
MQRRACLLIILTVWITPCFAQTAVGGPKVAMPRHFPMSNCLRPGRTLLASPTLLRQQCRLVAL